jgi:hypothetical protein
MQCGPYSGLAAPAGRVLTVLRPPATVSVAAAARTLLVMGMSSSFGEPQPCPARGTL